MYGDTALLTVCSDCLSAADCHDVCTDADQRSADLIAVGWNNWRLTPACDEGCDHGFTGRACDICKQTGFDENCLWAERIATNEPSAMPTRVIEAANLRRGDLILDCTTTEPFPWPLRVMENRYVEGSHEPNRAVSLAPAYVNGLVSWRTTIFAYLRSDSRCTVQFWLPA